MLTMDICIGTGFEKDQENIGVVIADRAIEGRVILKVSTVSDVAR